MVRRSAPSASRMPSSFVRWQTDKASTPATSTVLAGKQAPRNLPAEQNGDLERDGV